MSMLSQLLFLVALGSGDQVELSTLQREKWSGELIDLGPERLVLRSGEMRREIENAEVVHLRWPARAREKKTATAVAELWNGDLLRGTFQVTGEDRFSIRTGSGSVFDVRLDALRRIVFPKLAGGEDLALFPSGEGKDRLYPKKKGAILDFSNGTVEGFEGERVLFRGTRGNVEKFALTDLAALSLAPLDVPAEEKSLLALLELVDGSRVTGKLTALRGEKVELQSTLIGACSIETREIVSIRFKNARFRYLSDLDPVLVQESNPFGADEPSLFPFQKDRSVGGRPLRVGGVEFFRGLGVHSRCVLTYVLPKDFRWFRASLGIDDEVLELPARGSVIFRVLKDGKLAYESPIVRGGAAAIAMPDLDIAGVNELTLEVDFADDLHVADRADWLDPLLIP